MIDIIPTVTENITQYFVSNTGAVYTSWGEIWKLNVVIGLLSVFLGWGIGYHCYRLGYRFPWHKEK